MVLTEDIVALKRQSEDGEAKVREELYRRDKEQETTETAAMIEEIIEGISLQNRRGTIVRTISAIIRYIAYSYRDCVPLFIYVWVYGPS